MFAHDVEERQRCHWKAKLIGLVPLQDPLVAVSVCPTERLPPIVGAEVMRGATDVAATAFETLTETDVLTWLPLPSVATFLSTCVPFASDRVSNCPELP